MHLHRAGLVLAAARDSCQGIPAGGICTPLGWAEFTGNEGLNPRGAYLQNKTRQILSMDRLRRRRPHREKTETSMAGGWGRISKESLKTKTSRAASKPHLGWLLETLRGPRQGWGGPRPAYPLEELHDNNKFPISKKRRTAIFLGQTLDPANSVSFLL